MVYVPLKVDDLRAFLKDPTFSGPDFVGFSVTIPHKETALQCASKVRDISVRLP
jgi:3-dehydroquinate dehydratase/shikimate dehydrogenase